jgi:transketolase
MRKQFTKTIEKIFYQKDIALILGDIGVHAFRKLIKKYPKRAINIGILEQSSISFAAGLSKLGIYPIIHTIAPFMISRCFEQIKIDFGYQQLKGNFVSVGASYDYSKLGCTHHCPEDINLIKNIPNMQIVIPGNSYEFNKLFLSSYKNNFPTYFRLSERENDQKFKIKFGKANIIQKGNKATVIVVGPALSFIKNFIKKYDVNVIYITTIVPLDKEIIKKSCNKINKIMLIEQYYQSSLNNEISNILNKKINFCNISLPVKFLSNYGTNREIDKEIGFQEKIIEKKLIKFLFNKK